MRHSMRAALLCGLGLLVAGHVRAQAPSVQADHAWARATPASAKTAAVYVTLTDSGAAQDSVTGVSTPIAGMAMVHETIDDHGVMRMRMVDALPLPPGKPVTFKPGGLHVMLDELRHPLKSGDTFPITFTFAQSAPVTVTVTVGKNAAAAPKANDGMAGMKMDNGMAGMKMNGQ